MRYSQTQDRRDFNDGPVSTDSGTPMDLSNLDGDQKEVVQHTDGDALVMAGAGSGKTRCVQHRIGWLLHNGVSPRSIVAVSFTRDSADEIRERAETIHDDADRIHARTLHSLGYWILRQEGDFKTVVERPTTWFYDWFREVDWQSEEPPDYVLDAINEAKMQATSLGDFPDFFLHHDPERANQLTKLWERYEKRKKEERVVDFADMIWKAWQLLEHKPEIREKYQSKFQHLLVDESQDLNPAQMEIVDLLTQDDCSLMLIGDIRQSIYGFRGADPEGLIEFARDREMEFYHLPNNYRSCKVIVERSNELARQQEASHEFPDCDPVRSSDGKVQSAVLPNAIEEAKWVAKQVQSKIEQGTPPEEIGILYRVNAQSNYLQLIFDKVGVPYQIVGNGGYYQRKEVQDALSYLKVAHDETDREAFMDIYNTPTRYLGGRFRQEFDRIHQEGDSVIETCRQIAESDFKGHWNVSDLQDDLETIRRLAKADVGPDSILGYVYALRSKVDDKRTFRDLYKSGDDKDTNRTENLDVLEEMAKEYNSLSEFIDDIESQIGGATRSRNEEPEGVQLLTVHRSKGLEFEVVYVLGFVEDLFPHYRGDQNEERRVAYVAMTRAEDELVLVSPKAWAGNTSSVSRYIDTIGLNSVTVDRERAGSGAVL